MTMDQVKGVAAALVSSLLVAMVFAFVFRIPIPFWGYIGPFGEAGTHSLAVVEVVRYVIIAWVFYGA